MQLLRGPPEVGWSADSGTQGPGTTGNEEAERSQRQQPQLSIAACGADSAQNRTSILPPPCLPPVCRQGLPFAKPS